MGNRIGGEARALGYSELRPGQEEAVQALLEGRDVLVVMPTGYGKSAIYRIAARLLAGPTLVVSPLIALQKDQVDAIEAQDDLGAAEANSPRSASQRSKIFEELQNDKLEFLFLAPEQLKKKEALSQIKNSGVSLFVVDEAHCISAWGHDFRPDYLRLGAVAEKLGRPPILALTATASPPVRKEIVQRLRMQEPAVIVGGFDRPNIWLEVQAFHDESLKMEALLERFDSVQLPGIVYTATRAQAEEVCGALIERGLNAAFYHAGMKASDRQDVHQRFMADELEVVVATTAFGMGIDKANVRFVFHYSIPESLDSYYQEIGRAGRDGGGADAVLFYRAADVGLRRFFVSGGQVGQDDLQQVAAAAADSDRPAEIEELREEVDIGESKLNLAIGHLEQGGALEVLHDGRVRAAAEAKEPAGAVKEAAVGEEMHQKVEESRVAMMRAYAETRACRRQFLLNYFGETAAGFCNNCDNCASGRSRGEDEGEKPFALGSRVEHRAWGRGEVVRYEGDKLVVLFDQTGYKTLSVEMVVERGLLRAAR
ncbi:MAG: RecQ family ATP-dependent DNA helicase [Actinomycetota bacterium]|nr:RecQ family ATP-dependent DNA helicase [Actinomycetota bacterium]